MVGIANGPIGLVVFYEQDVKERVVERGLTTAEKIKRTSVISGLALFIPQLTVIPGTEDLMPYINTKTRIRKWAGSLVGFPILAAIISGIMQLIG
ncbi:hypothetical protein [Butyrivibrio sp. INlla16]|uniref:hypothetical protein n=1 Tax=Butyrivibrio sp. INlla16 TaxID=1520807 RepID=UPI001FA7570A|nr:hypothetical protein [Butyrivibrio sp. INlla16]